MIFETIAAIKIANEAVAAVKEMCGNVQSIGQLGPQLTKLADAKEELQEKAKDGSMEHFFELEKIRQQEAEIKQMFIYQGRAGLWDDYQRFMQTRKELREKERQREEARRLAKKKAIKDGLVFTATGLLVLGIVGGAVAFVLYLVGLKGK